MNATTTMTNTLTETERVALLTLCVMAAYADGDKDDRERAEVKRIVEGLDAPRLNTVLIYKEALTQPQPIADTVARLESPVARAMAYEMAVCICDADDVLDEREKQFLEKLRSALGLKPASAAEFQKQAEAITALPLPVAQGIDDGPFEVPVRQAEGQTAAAMNAESDKMILNYSILNAALELLPQSLATMAIIPLQMKMVYRIGKQHGFELDRGHIRDFLATVGVGLTSQVVEGYARKLLGGLIGKFAGGKMGKMGPGRRGTGGQFGVLLRQHLRARPGGEAILRGRQKGYGHPAQGTVLVLAHRGEGAAQPLPAADSGARENHQPVRIAPAHSRAVGKT